MKTIKFDKTLNLFIIEDSEIGAIINFTPEEFKQISFLVNVEYEKYEENLSTVN